MIPYGRQLVDDDDIAAVVDVLKGDWLTTGPAVERFEEALAARVEAEHGVVFSSGTAALHASMAASGIGPGDEVLTSPLSFVASANCARYVGAEPGFVDIEPDTLNIDLHDVPAADAVIPVHYAGLPVDLAPLSDFGGVVVEDASHALGAATGDGPIGNCARSDMSVFSFHPVKGITTGEGGAVTTNSEELAASLRRFRNHGIVPHPENGGWYYEIERDGYNYRLTDIQAALGLSQLLKLDSFIERRNEVADRYRELLVDVPGLQLPPEPMSGVRHAYHLFAVRVRDRRSVYERMRADGIGVQVHYVPIYRHPIMSSFGDVDDCPNTEAAYAELLSLPLFPAITDAEQARVVEVLMQALRV